MQGQDSCHIWGWIIKNVLCTVATSWLRMLWGQAEYEHTMPWKKWGNWIWSIPRWQPHPCYDCVQYHCTSGMPMCMANYCRYNWCLNKLAAPRLLMLEAMSDSLTDFTLRLPLLGTLTDCSDQRLTTCTETVFLSRSEAPTQPQIQHFSCSHACKCKQCIWHRASCRGITHTSGKRSQCNLEMRAFEFLEEMG